MHLPSQFANKIQELPEYKDLVQLLERDDALRYHILRAAHVLEATEQIARMYLTGTPEGFRAMHDFAAQLEIERDMNGDLRTNPDGSYVYPSRCSDPASPQYGMTLFERYLCWLMGFAFWPQLGRRAGEYQQSNPEYAEKLRSAMKVIRAEMLEPAEGTQPAQQMTAHDSSLLRELGVSWGEPKR